ncbi:TetR family transcriptional regulator [Sandaracinobacter neustonicus]|uniref:TetR family transcriptional regulator n=1 Tax=Sandaracinobacter neustonicus TaxID=1715348 RepID=A0A501XUG2_9SPHN|nr:TetR family transcriptional regulator [Sandaracinobacter neustonicus]TPE63727.1 TetR family transcriptional regulator [Sandaracinobacter neustonicus]
MTSSASAGLVNAARTCIVQSGIHGLSMRAVAREAGRSLGSLNYHIGDKIDLIARLIAEETAERQRLAEAWRVRTDTLDLADPCVLAAVIAAFLDEAATTRRDCTLAGCELLLDAGLDPAGYPGLAGLLEAEDGLWADCLAPALGAHATAFAAVISAYCRDELPFSLALDSSDYRLLRAATIMRVAEGFTGQGQGLALSFDRLVARCGEASADVRLPVDLPPGARRTELAALIARMIVEQGIGSISHRAVAARAETSNSSVAHHFRTREDLLQAGMGSLILGLRAELQTADRPGGERGLLLIRATHSIALSAVRDRALLPFALDMRRRRAENVRESIGRQIGGAAGLDGAGCQAAVIALVGHGMAAMARQPAVASVPMIDHIAALRTALTQAADQG